jgi:hypothetical protein
MNASLVKGFEVYVIINGMLRKRINRNLANHHT